MAPAKQGDKVKVHYTGTLLDQTEFDSSRGREPLEFVLGAGQMIPGFEVAVLGMQPGEEKTVTIPADQAYGVRVDELVLEVPLSQFPPHIAPQVGQQLQLQQPDGQKVVVLVTEVTDTQVTLDANHPLAGQDLIFALQLVSID